MIYFEIKNKTGKIIAGNIQEFPRRVEFENNKTFAHHKNGRGIKGVEVTKEDVSIWLVVEDEPDLLRSGKLFQKMLSIYKRVALDIWKQQKSQLEAHAHTLTTIQGQIRQQIEGFADDVEFYGETYSDSVDNITRLVKNSERSAADLICYIHKRIIDMRAHLLGVEVVHAGVQYEVKPVHVSLKRAILNQCSPFLEELNKNLIAVRFFFGDEHEVEVDKNMFSLVMYNFFSNAVKYAKPSSEIRLKYLDDSKSLDVSMISLKMEKNEISTLSDETTRGKHAKDFPGKGIGLFVLQKALELMGKERMYISANYENSSSFDDRTYVENHFSFRL